MDNKHFFQCRPWHFILAIVLFYAVTHILADIQASITFRPAPVDFGYRIKRIDLEGEPVTSKYVYAL